MNSVPKVEKGPQRKRKAAEPQPEATAAGKDPNAAKKAEDQEFFEEIRTLLEKREPDKNVLINIPIWGWTGDGKTCSMLTAVHFCDAAEHPLSLALITNADELVSLENSNEAYKYLKISSTAAATTERFRALSERFIDKNDWPPGTDEPSIYVLAVRTINSTLGYVMFPDIKGGSFREFDVTAKEVLRKAHAAVLLVNPELHHRQTTEGKRYRDEILAKLQDFTAAKIPVCVMITKADMYQGTNHATDSTHAYLTAAIQSQNGLVSHLCRVSVIGLDKDLIDNKLPPVNERNPVDLVKAWIWVVANALGRPSSEIRNNIPVVNIQATLDHSQYMSIEVQPEIRLVADLSNAPGVALCASGDEANPLAITFLSPEGDLIEAELGSSENTEPTFRPVGKIPGWADEPVDDLDAHFIWGEFLLGPKVGEKCNYLWQGVKGAILTKVPLPVELVSWAPSSSRRIIGLDASGRLHHFRLEGGKWVQLDFIESFISPTPTLVCTYLEESNHAIALNGQTVQGVGFDSEGRFGARVTLGLQSVFDSTNVKTNRLGMCLSIAANGQLGLSNREKQLDLGPSHAGANGLSALAMSAPLAAFVSPDLKVNVLQIAGDEKVLTGKDYSPVLHAAPESLIWTKRGELLISTFDDRTWSILQPFGLSV